MNIPNKIINHIQKNKYQIKLEKKKIFFIQKNKYQIKLEKKNFFIYKLK
jgi:hypothetical protein